MWVNPIGTYFGYTIAHYADFYDFQYLLVLGRVTTGDGGEVLIDETRNVLKEEFPELSEKISFHIPDENEKRHGQAIAAASLPVISWSMIPLQEAQSSQSSTV